jgi:tRNA threonylcarbamoyl adenosine modification protein (Sua5/YciO/YrdC/YwlC family)
MNTEIIQVDSNHPDEAAMKRAGALIAAGELVAFPTETVYGLGGDALDPEASGKIYAAKGRPSDNPLIVHIAEIKDLERVAETVPEEARRLADAFWPGPLTIIVRKNDRVPYATTGGMDTVAVRMPNHPVALALIRESGRLIAAPSANTSGRPSPTEAAHVAEDLTGKIPMILDGGPVGIGIESTIIDLTEEQPMVLRPGYITPQMLSEVIGREVIIDPGILALDDTKRPKAPGMKYKHYAPKADMVIVEGDETGVITKIKALTAGQKAAGKRVAVIASDETKAQYGDILCEKQESGDMNAQKAWIGRTPDAGSADVILSMGSRTDEDSIARHLYHILRECDELGVDVIYSESFSTPRIGNAIMNRLLKAAGHQVIQAPSASNEIGN